MTRKVRAKAPRPKAGDADESLDAAARGVVPTSDDGDDDAGREREIDVIGKAAGIAIPDGKPLGGPDEIERRDAHRWELDPSSAEDAHPSDEAPTKD